MGGKPIAVLDLRREEPIGDRAPRRGIERDHGLTKRGGLRQPHAAGNHRVEHEASEVAPDFFGNLLRQPRASVVHGQQETGDSKLRLQRAPDELRRLQELPEPLQGVVLALHRHYQVFCGC